MSFPKKIFQTWKERDVTKYIFLNRWQKTWKEYNPNYEYVLWTDEDNRKFIAENFPEFLKTYDSYSQNIKRVDAVRYFYLFKYGGIYADMDFECLKSFDNILESGEHNGVDIILGNLGPMDNAKNSLHQIPNALMLSKPREDFWKCVIKVMSNVAPKQQICPEYSTGSCLLTLCYDFYVNRGAYNQVNMIALYGKDIFEGVSKEINFSSRLHIVNPKIFYPINWGNHKHVEKYGNKKLSHEQAKNEFSNSYAVTYWMHSW